MLTAMFRVGMPSGQTLTCDETCGSGSCLLPSIRKGRTMDSVHFEFCQNITYGHAPPSTNLVSKVLVTSESYHAYVISRYDAY